MNDKLRILLISHYLGITGAPMSLLRHAKYLLSAGHKVDIWSLGDGALRHEYEKLGLKVKLLSDEHETIEQEVHECVGKYDLIVCNTIVTWRCAEIWQRTGIPVIWFIRETALLDQWYTTRTDFAYVFKHFYNLYCPSDYTASVIRFYNRNVRVVSNSVPDDFEGYTPFSNHVRFGYIGSLISNKGIDLLVESFLKLSGEHTGISLSIAGGLEWPLGKTLRNTTAGLSNVKWVGEVRGIDKKRFFDSIDVLCVPSLDEPFGLTVLEGAMRGKAVIVTDKTGAKDFVAGNIGSIVRAGSRQELYKALSLYANMGKDLLHMQQENCRRLYLKFGTNDHERAAVMKMIDDNVGNCPSQRSKDPLSLMAWCNIVNNRIFRYVRRILISVSLLCRGRGMWSRTGKRYY